MPTIEEPSGNSQAQPLASLRHTLILVSFFIVMSVAGAVFQQKTPASQVQRQAVDHTMLYLSLLVAEWALLFYVWKGIRAKKTVTFRELIGGRWKSPKSLAMDVFLAVGLWVVWKGVELSWSYLLPQSGGASINSMLPNSAAETAAWIVLSISAGICEEVVFRGYLMRQFAWMTKSRAAGLILQALVFGIAHGYQGFNACVSIAVLGCLFGLLALRRSSLRPGIIAHTLTDIVGGLFRF